MSPSSPRPSTRGCRRAVGALETHFTLSLHHPHCLALGGLSLQEASRCLVEADQSQERGHSSTTCVGAESLGATGPPHPGRPKLCVCPLALSLAVLKGSPPLRRKLSSPPLLPAWPIK